MAIRLITKKTGRLFAKTHCMMFYMGKGNNIYGKPYGIIPTSEEDPLGLTFDETNLTIYVNPGQAYCYGRQCIISEKTQVFDMHGILDGKCYATLYLRIDLSDIVDQFCTFSLVYGTEAFVDFDLEMKHSNLYKRGNGVYDVPISRFVYTAEAIDGKHFSNYEKLIPVLDEQARAVVDSPLAIGKTPTNEMFSGEKTEVRALQADMAKATNMIGSTRIYPTIDNVWTAQRVKILNQSVANFKSTTSKTIPIKIDFNHLVKAFISSEHYHYISSTNTRADICLMMHAKSGLILKQEADIFFPLKFDLELEKNVMYYAGFNRGSYFSWTTQKYKTVVIPLSISKEELVNNLFMFKLTDNGIYWKGTYTENTTAEEVDGKIWAILGDISIVTATISDGTVKDWFYGNQGKSVYVDFLYKGDVNVS